MSHTIDASAAGQLLRAVVEIADGGRALADRRQALLECLAELLHADSGHWVWGRGRPDDDRRLAVGFIPFGYSDDELKALHQFALDPQVQEELQQLLLAHLRQHPREDGVWSVIMAEVLAAHKYPPDNRIVQSMQRIGVAHWMQGGRYLPNHTFAVVVLGRRQERPAFSAADKDLIDLAMASVPWLWANPEETVPQDAVEVLSPRQRAVMFLVLDGLSRKKIAARLSISEETVNHHMKAIYQHFHVQSATELAALFLRSQ